MATTSPDRTGGSLHESVVHRLREAIVNGRLEPGGRIRQEEIARAFGTSRHPVREALRTLAGEGFVTIEPFVGARVATLDLQELVEVYLIRERLEPLALADSIRHMGAEDGETLRQLVSAMETTGSQGDLLQWLALDVQFHLASYRAASLPRLLRIIDGLLERAQRFRRLYVFFPHSVDISHTEHRLLVDAIERRVPEDAEVLLQIHIRRTRLALTEYVEQQGAPKRGMR